MNRPPSALRRPPSASSHHVTAAKHVVSKFSHVIRQRIVDADSLIAKSDLSAHDSAVNQSGAEDDAFFRNLRQREGDDQALLRTFGVLSSPSTALTAQHLQTLPSLPVFDHDEHEDAKIHFSVDGARLVLDAWVDEDGVTVTDEPRTMVP